MNLEISTWTRRESLERIASAERDRRAGRVQLALATLGEADAWPARLVLALIRLAADEGAEARAILEGTLDDWAAQAGLDPLDARTVEDADTRTVEDADAHEISVASSGSHAATDLPEVAESWEADARADAAMTPAPSMLEAPIEIDELDRAFAEAEAQTDEMLDVNTVAARVLMDEPVGLTEIDDDGPSEPMPGEPVETDAAWVVPPSATDADRAPVAMAPPTDYDVVAEDVVAEDVAAEDVVAEDAAAEDVATEEVAVASSSRSDEPAAMDAASVGNTTGEPPRKQVIETLERWLSNLERGRATRNAQQHRGA